MKPHDGEYDYAVSAPGAPVLAEAFGLDTNGNKLPAADNARLIGAAPTLLDALVTLTNTADGLSFREAEIEQVVGVTNWRVLRQHIEAARAAIAKATEGYV